MSTPKPKLQIVDLELGIDPQEATKKIEIPPETIAKAEKINNFDKQEYAALEAIRAKKQAEEQAREEGIDRAFKALATAAEEKQGVAATELVVLAGSTDLSGVMLRLRNYIKKRGDLWMISKHRENKQTVYYMEPTKAEEPPNAV
jgi:hypothetical protein